MSPKVAHILYYVAVTLWAAYTIFDFPFMRRPKLVISINGKEMAKRNVELIVYIMGLLYMHAFYKNFLDMLITTIILAAILFFYGSSKQHARNNNRSVN